MERLQCLLIGYLLGNLLTANLIVFIKRKKAGEGVGHGNSDMADVMNHPGLKNGMLLLLGDLVKTFFGCGLCAFLFRDLGRIVIFYGGLGVVIGHNYPIFHKFRSESGMTAICTAIISYAPLWGLFSILFGLLVVLVTGYFSLAAVGIAFIFLCFGMAAFPMEGIWLAFILAVLMIVKYASSLRKIAEGTEEKLDILGKLFTKVKKKRHLM